MREAPLLPTPDLFQVFPYDPYSVQLQLMRHIYTSIEQKKVTIIESPTGTGKTLSLLSASLQWLEDNKSRSKKLRLEDLLDSLQSDNDYEDPQWVVEQSYERMKNELEAGESEALSFLAALRVQENNLRTRQHENHVSKKMRKEYSNEDDCHIDQREENFLPDEMIIEDYSEKPFTGSANNTEIFGQVTPIESSAIAAPVKIIYSSRTHSQLSQVLGELRKLNLAPHKITNLHTDYLRNDTPNDSDGFRHQPRTVQLASRSHLCINQKVRAVATDLDEACRDLLDRKPHERCPYLPHVGDEARMLDLRNRILADIKDIEDLVVAGDTQKTCPYYGTRSTIAFAEVVALPYNLLLLKQARQSLGLDLKDHIIVIDEAHNLIESILQLHSVELPVSSIRSAMEQVSGYLNRFRPLLKSEHMINLKRLFALLTALESAVSGTSESNDGGEAMNSVNVNASSTEDTSRVLSVSAFVESLGNKVSGINLFELQTYLSSSKIARKASGYARYASVQAGDKVHEAQGNRDSKTDLPLRAIESFISCLTNGAEDGIIKIDTRPRQRGFIRYQHLNPAVYFNEITSNARSVVLAGGTMSPISDVVAQLFPSLPEDRLSIFTCGHVIPPSNLRCLTMGKGPTGKDLRFTMKTREDPAMLNELGMVITNLVNIVPNGMVVFLPSYTFLESVREAWTRAGMISRFSKKKQVFYEPQENKDVDAVLREYSSAANSRQGAILFAVVNAKLSEGLNFTNELARAVIIVGLPYPNLASPELKERMKYVENLTKKSCASRKLGGTELYENLCMRAVNQCIGRAVRHKNDWASILLIDNRYTSSKVRSKLPNWFEHEATESFAQAVKALGEFYRSMR